MTVVKPRLVLDSVIGPMRYLKSEAELALTEQAAHFADFGLEDRPSGCRRWHS